MTTPRSQSSVSNRHDRLYAKWDRWLEAIKDELVDFHGHRRVFLDLAEIVSQNPRLREAPSDFLEWANNNYCYSLATAIRRLSDNHRGTMSYRRLLEEIQVAPQVLSRARFKANFINRDFDEFEADACFDHLVGVGRDHIDPSQARSQIDDLKRETGSIVTLTNKRYAHHEDIDYVPTLTVRDAHRALDCLESIMRFYWSLFRCEDYLTAEPTDLSNWKSIFYFPWIEQE